MLLDAPLAVTLAVFAGFVFSIVVHEVAHAWTADKLGDPTARDMGRITLNPVPHIDPVMTIMLPLLLYLSSGFIFGGARPVPVDMRNFRRPLWGMMWVALAGPLSNVLLAAGFLFALNLTPALVGWRANFGENFAYFVFGVASVNVLLAVFNMLPIPPLDGSRIVAPLLPRHLAYLVYDRNVQLMGLMAVMILVYTGQTRFLRPIMSTLLEGLAKYLVWV